MLGPIIVFAVVYFFIATEKVDKTIAALIGAGVVIGLHFVDYKESMHAVDLNVIFLLIGMMVIVNILSETGVFEWIAIKVAKTAKGNSLAIVIALIVLTAVLSAFLDNVTTIILIAPITILLTQILEIPTAPILIIETIFSNVGGTATLIGDPPNILIGSQTHLTFNDFLLNLGPVVIVIIIVFVILTLLFFRKSFRTTAVARERILRSRPEKAIIQPKKLKYALVVFAIILAGFFFGHSLGIEPGIVAICGAMLMVMVCKAEIHESLKHVEWNTVLFFVGLFMLISSLEANGVFEKLGLGILHVCRGNLVMTTIAILWVSALASAVVDNIPLVMAMIPLVRGVVPIFAEQMGIIGSDELIHAQIETPLYWALALGACLGGNGTIIGASANVVIAQIAKRNKCKISFWDFMKYGFPFMIVSVLIATFYLYFRYFYYSAAI